VADRRRTAAVRLTITARGASAPSTAGGGAFASNPPSSRSTPGRTSTRLFSASAPPGRPGATAPRRMPRGRPRCHIAGAGDIASSMSRSKLQQRALSCDSCREQLAPQR
jgi:hypothetical protein